MAYDWDEIIDDEDVFQDIDDENLHEALELGLEDDSNDYPFVDDFEEDVYDD